MWTSSAWGGFFVTCPESAGESAQHERAVFYGANSGMDPDELELAPA